MSQKILFGTDGWRGTIAEQYTFENVRRCTQGFASYLTQQGDPNKKVVVGFDRRFQSDKFAMAAAEVLIGNGFVVYLTQEPTPTPTIAYSIVNLGAIAGVNITASHNPPQDNGYKVRDCHGGAIDPEGLKSIEHLIPESTDQVKRKLSAEGLASGQIIQFDPAPDYIKHLKGLIDLEPIKDAGLKIVADPMWGNGAGWFSKLLSGGKTQVVEINNAHNPLFPGMGRPEPIPPNINNGLQKVIEVEADVLLITDGDADRVGIGDENGVFVNQLQAYALLAYYLLEVRKLRGPIVRTLSTTGMLDKLGKIYNVPVYETGVGFKYVAPKMIETNALIGGEESGGFAFKGNVPERDGILAGLYFLDMMVKLKRKPSELLELLFSVVGEHYYDRIDTKFTGNREAREKIIRDSFPDSIAGLKVTRVSSSDGFKFNLDDGGWLLIRFSGTEPIIRVYCETTHKDKVCMLLNEGLKIAGIEK